MKEALVQSDLSVHIVDSPIPTPNADQVLIKVVVSGCNPKDWKQPVKRGGTGNTGDDIAGVVHAVGENVYEFKAGDRVAAFHEMGTLHGSYAEYAIAWQFSTFHLANNTSFEEAATIPLAAMTAALGLYERLRLPVPWSLNKPNGKQPLLVYGAASAVGAFAIQFARLSGLHPIIGVAGKGIPFAESLIDKSKGDTIIDYRKGNEAVITGIKSALKAAGCTDMDLRHCFDGISEHGSPENISAVLNPKERYITNVRRAPYLPYEKLAETEGGEYTSTMVGSVHHGDREFGYVYFRYISRLLAERKLKAHPFEKRGGLEAVSQALKDLMAGKASAIKYIFEVGSST